MAFSQTALARAIGVPPRRICELLERKRTIGAKLKAIRPRAA